MIPLSVQNSIVRILSKRDDFIGLGFLIDDQHIMTCAHVVGGALGVRAETIEMPSSLISLDFPFIKDSQALEGSVIHWRPPKPHASAGEVDDIAVIHLNSKKPDKVTPVIPLRAKKLSGHKFQTFGYPKGYGNFPVFADGEMGEQGPGGRIQIESLKSKGIPVQKGFSGSPVWDEDLGEIVGIVVGSMERDWISFIIPTGILKESWPSLTTRILGLNSIPKLPDHIVRRQNQVNEINDMLLSKCSNTKDAKIVGIYGMGGSGKSIIAAMAVLESEIQENFPDGIFWIKLGKEVGRKLAERQSALMTSLGYSQAISDIDDGKKQLIKKFEDLTCLIVLDDLWDLKHLKAFDITGQKCRMLITTRDPRLIPIGAKSYHLPLLNDEESLKLLADSANENVDELPIETQRVREKCGNLPLALAMIGGMVSSKFDRWDNVYRKLAKADIGKIKFEFSDHDYDYADLIKSLQVSIEALDPKEQKCYLDLAVFPEDTPIPENTLINFLKYEDVDEEEAKEILERFVSLSLIMRSESTLDLHDIQHLFVKNQANDLRSLHNRFLKAYGEKANWPLIADDGYFFKYLSYHLIAAGRLDDLKELLLNIKWMSAKMKASGITSLISDYDYLKESDEFRLIQGALQLSAHILNRDPKQLPSQLYGRLIGHESPQIQMFLEKMLKFKEYFWLRPCFPSLAQSGDPLLQTILSHSGYIIPFAIVSKGKRVILGLDGHYVEIK